MQMTEFKPKIVAFCCNWCSYAGADLAGNNRLNYPAEVKIIRVPCSCRVNPMFILRAFQRGMRASTSSWQPAVPLGKTAIDRPIIPLSTNV